MDLSQIGEFGLIGILKDKIAKRADTVVGIGDDAAVIEIRNNYKMLNPKNKTKYLLVTTDALVEGVHFRIEKGNKQFFFNLGYKALLANISDIAAMGGYPTHALATLGLPPKTKVESIEQLYAGINALAKRYKIDIIGGDTVASPKALFISITLLGEVEKKNLLLRSGAKTGHLICVTGRFGGASAKKYAIGGARYSARIRTARLLAKSGAVSAMIDSSDGLAPSIGEICKASKVGARIWEAKIPIAKGAALSQALYGGEEYELVFTVQKNQLEALKRKKIDIAVVGEVVGTKKEIKLVDNEGKIKELKSDGFDHFK